MLHEKMTGDRQYVSQIRWLIATTASDETMTSTERVRAFLFNVMLRTCVEVNGEPREKYTETITKHLDEVFEAVRTWDPS